MKSKSTLFYSSALVVLFSSFQAHAQSFNLPELTQYYSSLPGQYIVPTQSSLNYISTPIFYLDETNTYTPVGDREHDLEYSQELFKVDGEKFIQSMSAADFLEAKIKFYSGLKFSNRWQKHEAPYRYMNGWLSLNHPPVKKMDLPLGSYNKNFSNSFSRPETSTYFSTDFQNKLDSETGTELTFGNNLKALVNGNSIKEKTRLVNDAKRYVFGAVMATICDESSEEFVQALINKAQSGIPVTLMMEKFYMGFLYRKCTNRLRNGGVDVVLVNDKWKSKSLLTFFHAKFWIRDGEEVIVGGQNIVKYENNATGYNQLNRDTDLLIQGPSVTDFLSEYLSIWEDHAHRRNQSLEHYQAEVTQTKEIQRLAHVRGKDFYNEKLGNPATRMQGACRVLVQHPYNENLSIAQVLRRYTEESKQSITLTSPEIDFNLKKQKSTQRDLFFQATKDAANRGVKIDLILNGVDGGNGEFTAAIRDLLMAAQENGKKFQTLLWNYEMNHEPQKNARGHREFLLNLEKNPGYRTWTHFNYMHAKQGYFDRIATSISSLNLDKASAERNYEAGVVCMDEDLSNQMENQLTLDLVNSVPVVSSNENQSTSEEMELSSQDQE